MFSYYMYQKGCQWITLLYVLLSFCLGKDKLYIPWISIKKNHTGSIKESHSQSDAMRVVSGPIRTNQTPTNYTYILEMSYQLARPTEVAKLNSWKMVHGIAPKYCDKNGSTSKADNYPKKIPNTMNTTCTQVNNVRKIGRIIK